MVLALTAALVVPYFVDWTGYRADFEREASRVLGRKVVVQGKVTARLVPFPSVSFSDVRVGDPRHDPVMTIKTFSMDAEIAPLLSGEVLIYDMRIDDPRAVLTVDKDGTVDWTIRPSTPFDPKQITLEKVVVSGGSVDIVDNQAGTRHRIRGLNATMSASTLAGPWRMQGTASLDGERARLTLSTNEVKPDGKLRLHARVEPDNLAAVIDTDGDVAIANGRVSYAGTLDIRSSDLISDAGDGSSGTAEPAKSGREAPLFSKVRVTGRFQAEHARLVVPEFRIEQGPSDNPYVVNGNARFDYGATPGFAITANGQQIFLGGGAEAKSKERPEQAASGGGSPFSARLAAFKSLLAAVPIPDIPGTVDLNLPAIIAGGTTIHDVAVKAEPAKGGWSISRFTADLPGRTQVEASGKLLARPELRFDGSLLVASRQPSGLAAWLTGSVDESIRRLTGAGFSADVSLTAGTQRFDKLEVDFGPTTLTGSVLREAEGRARPSIQARLEGKTLDVDALQALKSFLVGDNGTQRLSGSDLDISLKAGPVSGEGLRAASVDTAFRLSQDRLDIDRLTISDVGGATLTATGKMMPFASTPTGSIDATLLSSDLGGLVSTLAERFPSLPVFSALRRRAELYPGLLQETELSIIGSAARGKNGDLELSLSGNGKAGGTTLTFTGLGKGDGRAFDAMDLAITANAKNPEGETLLALLGLPALPLQMTGEIEGDFSLAGRLSDGAKTHLALAGQGTRAVLDGSLRVAGGEVAADGRAQLKSEDLDPYLAVTGHALPGFGNGLAADVASDFDLKDGRLRLAGLSGTVGGGPVAADLDLAVKDGVPSVTGKAKLGQLDLPAIAAFLFGPAEILPSDKGWPETAFAPSSSFPLDAELSVSADRATMARGAGITGFSADLSLSADDLRISGLKGKLDGGDLGGLAELRNTGGTALASAQMTLNGADLAAFYKTSDGAAPFGGRADISASLNATGKSMAGLMSSLTGSGVVSSKSLTIAGLDAGALAPIVKESDEAGHEATPAQLAAIVAKHFPAGRFDAGDVDLPFTIAAGVARLSGIRMATAKAELTAAVRADIGRDGLDGSSAFTFDPGDESVAGAVPAVQFALGGTIEAPRVAVDPQPMIQFLTQRALEREQQRVEAMQAVLLEKQRLRREAQLYQARADERQRLEEERKRAEEEARRRAAEEAVRQADEAAKQKAAETEAQKKAAGDAARQKALDDAQQRAILDAQRKGQPSAPADTASPPAGGAGSNGGAGGSDDPVKLLPSDQRTIDNLLRTLKIPQQ